MSLPQSSKQEGSNLKVIREQFNAVYPIANRCVEDFAPDYAHKSDLKKDITHILLTSPESGKQAECNAIRHILRIRGRVTYVRPIAEKKNYLAKHFDLDDTELNGLPEMERIALLMRDQYLFDSADICNLLQININQLQWLYFNTDSILGPNRKAVIALQGPKIPNAELNRAWIYYAAAFHAQPIQKAPGVLGKFALTYVSFTLVALLGILGIGQLYLNLRTKEPDVQTVAQTRQPELERKKSKPTKEKLPPASIINSQARSNMEIVKKGGIHSIHKYKTKEKSIAKPIVPKASEEIAISTIHTIDSEEPIIAAILPNAIGIHSQKKLVSTGNIGLESRRIARTLPFPKKKYGLFARIGVNSLRNNNILTTGSIALGMKVNIQSRIALRISIGIAHLSHKSETVIQKQYQSPSTSSPIVVDSVIFNGLRVGQLHISQEMQVTKNIIVHAGGIVVYRMANIGEAYTSNSTNTESTPFQHEGIIAPQQTFDFAHFNRDPLYSRIMGGVCAGISWRPPLLSHKMLLRAEFNYLPLYRRINGPVPISRSAEMQLIIEI